MGSGQHQGEGEAEVMLPVGTDFSGLWGREVHQHGAKLWEGVGWVRAKSVGVVGHVQVVVTSPDRLRGHRSERLEGSGDVV